MQKDPSFEGHFSYGRVYKLAIAPIIMMVFSSIYSIVDGVFVSNFVGKDAFAAVNIVMPVTVIFASLGFMIGTGGTALVGKLLGEKKEKEAMNAFSNLAFFAIVLGAASTIVLYFVLPYIFMWLGASGDTLDYCLTYGRVLCLGFIPAILQNAFQPFFALAGKPKTGLFITVLAGLTNMGMDALLMLVAKEGLFGAALATVLSQCIGGFVPLLYFFFPNKSLLRLGKFHFAPKSILQACWNGSSELLSNISLSVVNILYNSRLIALLGNNGVAAYGVIMYVSTIFVMIFIGFDIAIGPIVSYKYGAGEKGELKNLLRIGLTTVFSLGAILTILAEASARGMALVFTSYDEELLSLTTKAIRIYMLSFLICGMNFFSSCWFTSLNDGLRSAIISFSKTMVFQIASVLILSSLFGENGLWCAVIVSEGLSAIMSLSFLLGPHRYGKNFYSPRVKKAA